MQGAGRNFQRGWEGRCEPRREGFLELRHKWASGCVRCRNRQVLWTDEIRFSPDGPHFYSSLAYRLLCKQGSLSHASRWHAKCWTIPGDAVWSLPSDPAAAEHFSAELFMLCGRQSHFFDKVQFRDDEVAGAVARPQLKSRMCGALWHAGVMLETSNAVRWWPAGIPFQMMRSGAWQSQCPTGLWHQLMTGASRDVNCENEQAVSLFCNC